MKAGLKGLRIGVIEHFYKEDAEADPDQVRAIEQAVDVLRKLGASVKTIRLSPLPLWTDCNRTIHQAEAYAIHERDVQERPEDFAALTRNRLLPGAFVSAAKYIRAQQLRAALCREFADAMRDLDAVVTLSSLLPAVPDRRSGGDRADLRPAMPARLQRHRHAGDLGADRTHRHGVPLAMQIAGRAFDEPMVYRIAQAYCEAAGTCIGADVKTQPRLVGTTRAAAE